MQQTGEILSQLAADVAAGRAAFEAHARELEREGEWTQLYALYEQAEQWLGSEEGYWEAARERLRECIARVEAAGERAEALNVLAELHVDHLDDALGAVQVWGEAFRADRSRVDLIEHASAAALAAQEWRAACNLLELRARIAKEEGDQRALLTRAAEIAADELGDEAHAGRLRGLLERIGVEEGEAATRVMRSQRDEKAGDASSSPISDAGAEEGDSEQEAAGEADGAARDVAAEALAAAEAGQIDEAVKQLRGALRAAGSDRGRTVPLLETLGQIHWQIREDAREAAAVFKRLRLADARNELMLRWFAEEQRDAGDWKRLFATLLSLRDVVPSLDEVRVISDELVEVAMDRLQRPERAIDALKGALRRDPDYEEGRARLRELLAAEGKWNALVELLREAVERTPEGDREELVALHEELARIYSEELNLPAMVTTVYQALLEVDPTNERAVEALAERFQSAGRWNELATLHAQRIPGLKDPAERAETWRRVASIRHDQLGNPLLAAEAYEALLADLPGDREALRALQAIYEGRQDAASLFRIRELEAEQRPVGERVAALIELADAAFRELGDAERSIRIYRRILEDVPEHEGVADALEELLAAEGRQAERIAFLRERLMQREVPDPELSRRLARLLMEGEEGRDEAETLWRDILVEAEQDAEALEALEQILGNEGRWLDLEALQREAGRLDVWLAQLAQSDTPDVEALRRGAALAADELDDEALQLSLLLRLDEIEPDERDTLQRIDTLLAQWPERAEERLPVLHQLLHLAMDADEKRRRTLELARFLWGQLEDGAGAFPWYMQILEEEPEEVELWAEVSEAALSADLARPLFEAMKQAAARMARGPARLELHRLLARQAMGPAQRREEALGFWVRVLEQEAEDREALEAMLALQRELEMWEDLASTLLRCADLAEESEDALQMRCEAASLMALEMEAFELALGVLDEILEDDPEHAAARALRRRVLESAGRWDEVFAQLRADLEEARGADAAALRLALAEAITRHGEPGEEVVELLSEAVEDPAHAAPAEKALLEHVRAAAAGTPQAARLLLQRIHGSVDAPTLALLVDPALAEIEEESERRSLLMELAERWVEAEEPQEALATLRRTFAHGTPDADELSRQRSLAQLAGTLDELAELWSAGLALDPERELGLALASLLREDLEREASAVEVLETLREAEPEDREVLELLEGLYRADVDGDALVEVLLALAELDTLESDVLPGTRGWERHERAVELLRGSVGRPDAARPVLEQMMDLAPEASEPAEQLEDLLTELESWSDLEAFLLRRLALSEALEERVQLYERRAALLDGPLARPEEAVQAWQGLLDEVPDHEGALTHLDRLHAQLGNPRERLGVLRERLRNARDGVALGLRLETAVLLIDELDEAVEAVPLLAEVLATRPEHPVAYALACRLWEVLEEDAGARQALAEALASALEEGSHEADIALRRSLLRARVDAGALPAAQGWMQVAELAAEEGAIEEELGALIQALVHAEAGDGVAPCVQRISAALSDRAHAEFVIAQLDEQLGEKLPALAQAAAALLHLRALLAEEVEEDAGAAIDAMERACALDPEDASLRDTLERLLERSELWPELVDALRWRAEATSDGAARAAWLRRAGLVLAHRIGDQEEAVDALQQAVAAGANDPELHQILGLLLSENERWDDLATCLEARASGARQEGERAAALLELARLCRTRLLQRQRALDALRAVLEIEPDSSVAAEELRTLLLGMRIEHGVSTELLDTTFGLALTAHPLPQMYEAAFEMARFWARELREAGDIGRVLERVDGLLTQVAAHEAWSGAGPFLAELVREPSAFLQIHPSLEKALPALTGAQAVLEAALDGALEATDVQAGEILPALAGLAQHVEGGEAVARRALQEALDRDPENAGACKELEALLRRMGDMEALAVELERRMGIAASTQTRRELTLQLGALREEALGDPEGARAVFEAWLLEDPADSLVREELTRICRVQEDFDALAEALEEWLEYCEPGEERRALMLELASLHEHERKDPAEAAEVLLRRVGVVHSDPIVVEELLRLLEAADRWTDIVEVLIAAEASGELAADYRHTLRLRRIRLLAFEMDAMEEALTLLLAMEDGIGPLEGAPRVDWLTLLEDVLRDEGCDLDSAIMVSAFARREGIPRIQRAALEAGLRDAVGSAVEADLLVELAELERELEEPVERQFELWGQALVLRPEDEAVLEALVGTGNMMDAPARIAAVLDEARETGDAPARLLVMLADLYVARLDAAEEALGVLEDLADGEEPDARRRVLQQVIEVPALRERALEEYDPLLQPGEDPPGVVSAVLQFRLSRAEDAVERALLLEELALLHEATPALSGRAFDFASLALSEVPDSPDVLERAERLAEDPADWHRLVSQLMGLAAEIDDRTRATELLERAARLALDRLDDRELALDAVEEGLAQDEAAPELARIGREALEAAGRDTRPELWVSLTRRVLEAEPDLAKVHEESLALARYIIEEGLGNEAARELLDPLRDAPAWSAQAWQLLERLALEEEDWEELAALLEDQALRAESPEEALSFRLRLLALLDDEVGDALRCVDVAREVLQQDPQNAQAGEVIERRLTEGEEWSELQDYLMDRLGSAGEGEASGPWLLRLADNCMERLDDPEGAVPWLQQARGVEGVENEAQERLEAIYRRLEYWNELAALLAERCEGREEEETYALRREQALLLEERLQDFRSAEPLLRTLREERPDDPETAASLLRILVDWGSDEVPAIVEELRAADHQEALRAGLQRRGGDYAALLD